MSEMQRRTIRLFIGEDLPSGIFELSIDLSHSNCVFISYFAQLSNDFAPESNTGSQ